MANEFKVKKGLIVQGSGSSGDNTILDVQGNQGQLFSITDSLSGSLFSVGDISGIPILDVNSNEIVKIGTFGSEGIIVNGSNVTASGNISSSGTVSSQDFIVGYGGSINATDTSGNTNDIIVANLADAGLIFGDTDMVFQAQGSSHILDSVGTIKIDSDSGDVQFQDNNVTKITFNTTAGHITASGTITANAFVGDGSSITGISGFVDTSGTVNANEFARFSDSNTLTALTAAETRDALNVADGANNYVLPTNLAGDDINVDTGALTGATVISDLDFNVTTNASGLVTDANGTVATRTLTLANLGYTGTTDANTYVLPTNLAGDDISVDTGALTGATVISDLDFNITTNTSGLVTDANGSVATRTLTLANLGYTGTTDANTYVLPTNLAGDDIDIDTTAWTGATVISDLDINITTNTSGLVTDANGSVATRTLTLANLGYTGATDANKYVLPTNLAGDDISVDTGALTGATVISDLDFNVTTNSSGLVTDANGTVATRNLTLGDLGYTGATNANNSTANATHTGDVTGATTLTIKTNVALAGNPTTTTQSSTNDSTRIATTAFVHDVVEDVIGNAGSTLDTLGELSASLATTTSSLNSLITTVGTKLAKSSNLSDLTNAGTARSNLGLGSVAVEAASSFATSTQGTTADNAAAKASNLSDLANAGTARSNLGLGGAAVLGTAAVTNGATTLATGDQIYDHVTTRISGLTSNAGTVTPSGTINQNEFAVWKTGTSLKALTAAETRDALNVADGANNYVLPTNLAGDDISVDTGALTGATVISDLDFNVTTNSSGLVTDANGTVATRNLTLGDLGYTGATNANNFTYTLPLGSSSTRGGVKIGYSENGKNYPVELSSEKMFVNVPWTDNNTVYTHPTFNGDDFSVDTGALTGATVVSDIDINVTTDGEGHVTDANGSVATRTLTLANLGYTGATDANNYVLPTNLAGDDINVDTGALTGATVISDLDFNVTTNSSGLVTDANGTVATRTLTAANLSLGNVTNESKATMFSSPTFTGNSNMLRRNLDLANNILNQPSAGTAKANGDIFFTTGNVSTTAGKIYYMLSNGGLGNADADAASSATGLLCVALGTSSSTNGMLLRGIVALGADPGGNPGSPLYLSTTPGNAQTSAPSGTNDIARIIGYKMYSGAEGINVIYFNPDNSYVTVG
jgi:hypothetical protein